MLILVVFLCHKTVQMKIITSRGWQIQKFMNLPNLWQGFQHHHQQKKVLVWILNEWGCQCDLWPSTASAMYTGTDQEKVANCSNAVSKKKFKLVQIWRKKDKTKGIFYISTEFRTLWAYSNNFHIISWFGETLWLSKRKYALFSRLVAIQFSHFYAVCSGTAKVP